MAREHDLVVSQPLTALKHHPRAIAIADDLPHRSGDASAPREGVDRSPPHSASSRPQSSARRTRAAARRCHDSQETPGSIAAATLDLAGGVDQIAEASGMIKWRTNSPPYRCSRRNSPIVALSYTPLAAPSRIAKEPKDVQPGVQRPGRARLDCCASMPASPRLLYSNRHARQLTLIDMSPGFVATLNSRSSRESRIGVFVVDDKASVKPHFASRRKPYCVGMAARHSRCARTGRYRARGSTGTRQ